ncbi:TetR/AcrR family transcriptional regulator [Pseudonocardia alaniniphila]|uniref:TetR/AcrR family transcriptional regulator n=1 Tax=Pseudonocardia alaniniphila TaxID=75291 RepID=A0ABS9TPZ9_9PSEU|nr:TetR/AcrR family transcriptional regulator [Pseudonocardia alaniniphila]MCH6170625.1 TetR/AcrR family transcriptional regulator [Pseudonocardia alaniniphila]
MTAEVTGLRADARRNRDQIVAAAKQWFAVQGPDVPMEEIARAAGVGVGTLYRRFPDREALIRAVVRESLTISVAEARAALAEEPTAWQALVRVLRQSRELRLIVRLTTAAQPAKTIVKDDEESSELRRAMIEVLDNVVHAAQAEGALRTDVDTGDVSMLFTLLVRPVPLQDEETAELARERCTALVLDGLRAHTGTPLPGRPLTAADVGL